MSASLNYQVQVGPEIEGKYRNLFNDFMNLLSGFGVSVEQARSVVKSVWDHYEHPNRHYHNLDHIQACLRQLAWLQLDSDARRSFQMEAQDVRTIELTLWFHDVIYDTNSAHNEELSVVFLREVAAKLKIEGRVEEACIAILATRHTAVIPTNDVSRWVVDIDLSILHTGKPVFDAYEKGIRKEYAHVSDPLWIKGRTQVLQGFLDREWIYSTPLYRRLYEGQARANIKRSLARLEKGEIPG